MREDRARNLSKMTINNPHFSQSAANLYLDKNIIRLICLNLFTSLTKKIRWDEEDFECALLSTKNSRTKSEDNLKFPSFHDLFV